MVTVVRLNSARLFPCQPHGTDLKVQSFNGSYTTSTLVFQGPIDAPIQRFNLEAIPTFEPDIMGSIKLILASRDTCCAEQSGYVIQRFPC
jgi:hypothetical protein